MADLNGVHYTKIIDEIFAYPGNYTGFAIKPAGGTVRYLAHQFDLSSADVVVVLSQMLADGQLIEAGFVYPDETYKPSKEQK